MPVYNKLVRDGIPQIIEQDNHTYTMRTLSDEEYVLELRKKLGEELQEYLQADNDKDAIEELADVLELMHALTTVHGSSPDALEQIRRKKADKRGGFAKKLFLIETHAITTATAKDD
ncbi:MAG: phosphoribosyl-ATP pyrophosphohydrolase [Alicyclobacillus sp. RIFOXYA1_FULL_53_8]|nr:MAG: phosphoribosyl-ATP pyrophosphohydrolase [Alicyclobacillus sp. RIFOXYA1_FULL_53_8]